MTYLMNPLTGSVATLEEWREDFEACDAEDRKMLGWPERFEDADLVEVVGNDEDGYYPLGDFCHYFPEWEGSYA